MQAQTIATSYASILGQMLRQKRSDAGMDQRALADRLGVSLMTVSRIENGDTVLDVPQMEKAALLFGMDPVEFFKKSLEAKKRAEESYKVYQSKKEINRHPELAILGVAAVIGLVAAVLFSKK